MCSHLFLFDPHQNSRAVITSPCLPPFQNAAHPAFDESVAGDYIPESTFVKIAERLPRDWVRLGVKLGVPYTTIERLRVRHTADYLPAVMEMFGIWQRSKGREATKRALKRALVDMNFGRLAVECFNDVQI
jgi:hypothetical protein